MKYSVVLQDPFDYAILWIEIGAGLILAAGLVWLLLHLPEIKAQNWREIPLVRRVRIYFRKKKHTKNVRRIEKEFAEHKIDGRNAYQQISKEVRQFAQAATGVPIESLVYSELVMMNYPELTNLIGQLYVPEFAVYSQADVAGIIRRSKELIKKWR
ncbi:MAG: hypothetical protein IJJ50_03845 [Lachnospiraceae bacterium]|nr:hypothetical protein [Lachnospiraceae bacterium]